jgi:hypothetical protein
VVVLNGPARACRVDVVATPASRSWYSREIAV